MQSSANKEMENERVFGKSLILIKKEREPSTKPGEHGTEQATKKSCRYKDEQIASI